MEQTSADIHNATRLYLQLPTHKQLEVWKKLNYPKSWSYEMNMGENNDAFFKWVKLSALKEFVQLMIPIPMGEPKPTVDKEAILRKHVSTITFGKLIGTPMAQVFEAMDEHAASLIKERDELKELCEGIRLSRNEWINGFNESQSSNEAKDKEIAELKADYDEINNLYKAQKAEAHKWRDFVTDKEKELEQQVAELREQISTYKGRIDRLHQSLEESEKQFQELQELYTKLLYE